MIITFGGPIGSGKTTVAQGIAKRFGLKHLSAGLIFREMAKEKGLSLEEFSRLAEKDESFDRSVDERQRQMALKGDSAVDGRLSGRFIDADMRIWLTAPLETRVERVSKREDKPLDVARREIEERERSECKRYKKLYNIDLYDISMYDAVLNTALWDASGVIEIIEKMIEVKL